MVLRCQRLHYRRLSSSCQRLHPIFLPKFLPNLHRRLVPKTNHTDLPKYSQDYDETFEKVSSNDLTFELSVGV